MAPVDIVTQWLEREIGGRVVSIEPQARWRPVWFAEVDRDGERLAQMLLGPEGSAMTRHIPIQAFSRS